MVAIYLELKETKSMLEDLGGEKERKEEWQEGWVTLEDGLRHLEGQGVRIGMSSYAIKNIQTSPFVS